ncbi:MAG: HAD-IC family P-type ATPase [Microbacteriaceae bacterium]
MATTTDRAELKAAAAAQRLEAARDKLAPLDENLLERNGLTSAQVRERIVLDLVNRQQTDSSRSLASILRSNLLTLFNAVVGGSFILLLVLGQWKDALFGFAVVANVLIGIIQEFTSKRTLDRLALLHAPTARVTRDGEIVDVKLEEIVLDDLIELRPGDQVLADAVVVDSESLEVDESMLTGESDPVEKSRRDAVLSGSGVVAGRGAARVVRIGSETYASKITLEARRFSMVNSELRNALARIVRWITWLLIPVMAIVINGQMQAHGGWAVAISDGQWLDATVASIASIISMIPQGLVLITSIAFAVSAVKLARAQVLVQELPAVEGLARVDVMCFDKTGTLTEGEIVFDDAHPITGHSGDDWRRALVVFANDPDANATARCLRGHFAAGAAPVVASVPFSSARKWSAFQLDGTDALTWVFGAPELVLVEGTPAQQDALGEAARIAATGRRTLVLASSLTPLPTGDSLATGLVGGLVPRAIVTFREKIRPDAAETLSYFREQGVAVRIISGDNPATVAAIARDAGVFDDLRERQGDAGSASTAEIAMLMEGFDARNLPEEQAALAEILETHRVFGRVTPDQKRDMVLALQSRGHVVAMTGDGVNDALALKKADLGIAMGSGTPATKAVARLILLDGKFANLPSVVSEGRRVIANIERVSRLFLTKTAWAMTLAIVFGAFLWQFPFLPRQLSAMDGYTIGLASFGLALLPNTRRYVPGFLRRSLSFCIPAGIVTGAAIIALYLTLTSIGTWSVAQSQTATSVLMSITGLWVLTGLARPLNAWRIAIVAAMYAMCVGVFEIPFIRDFFGFVTLEASQLVIPCAIALGACVLITLVNVVSSRVGAPRETATAR